MNKYIHILKFYFRSASTEQLVYFFLTIETLTILLSGVGFHSLFHTPFFNIGIDPIFAFFFSLGIPQFIVAHQWLGIALDGLMIFIPVCIAMGYSKRILKISVFFMLLIYYCTLTGYLGHRNFQSGFVFVTLPFLFRSKESSIFMKSILRYWILFFYFSAGLFKIMSAEFYRVDYFSQTIADQFLPYFAEQNLHWRTSLHLWILTHPGVGYFLYTAATLLETSLFLGFFTRKFDKYYLIFIISFHGISWILLDIAPWGQLTIVFYLLNTSKIDK
jgi:hypothetical protein